MCEQLFSAKILIRRTILQRGKESWDDARSTEAKEAANAIMKVDAVAMPRSL